MNIKVLWMIAALAIVVSCVGPALSVSSVDGVSACNAKNRRAAARAIRNESRCFIKARQNGWEATRVDSCFEERVDRLTDAIRLNWRASPDSYKLVHDDLKRCANVLWTYISVTEQHACETVAASKLARGAADLMRSAALNVERPGALDAARTRYHDGRLAGFLRERARPCVKPESVDSLLSELEQSCVNTLLAHLEPPPPPAPAISVGVTAEFDGNETTYRYTLLNCADKAVAQFQVKTEWLVEGDPKPDHPVGWDPIAGKAEVGSIPAPPGWTSSAVGTEETPNIDINWMADEEHVVAPNATLSGFSFRISGTGERQNYSRAAFDVIFSDGTEAHGRVVAQKDMHCPSGSPHTSSSPAQ